MADDNTTTSEETSLDNAPTETTQGGDVVETSGASRIATSDNLASNVVSKTTNDLEHDSEQDIEDAKALALHNHAVEHADDPTPMSGDKTAV